MKNKKEFTKSNSSTKNPEQFTAIDRKYFIGLTIIVLIPFVVYMSVLQNGFVLDDVI